MLPHPAGKATPNWLCKTKLGFIHVYPLTAGFFVCCQYLVSYMMRPANSTFRSRQKGLFALKALTLIASIGFWLLFGFVQIGLAQQATPLADTTQRLTVSKATQQEVNQLLIVANWAEELHKREKAHTHRLKGWGSEQAFQYLWAGYQALLKVEEHPLVLPDAFLERMQGLAARLKHGKEALEISQHRNTLSETARNKSSAACDCNKCKK